MKRTWGGRLLSIGIAFGLAATHTPATGAQAKPAAGAQTKPPAKAPTNPAVSAQARAQENLCLANAKQITTAIMMYVKANKGVTPKDADYMNALTPYNKKPEIFQCPLDPKGTVSYTMNSAVAGTAINTVLLPSSTVLIYEGTGGKLNFKHSGRAVVGFVDGRCSLVDASRASTLIWTVQAPKPVTPITKKPAGK